MKVANNGEALLALQKKYVSSLNPAGKGISFGFSRSFKNTKSLRSHSASFSERTRG